MRDLDTLRNAKLRHTTPSRLHHDLYVMPERDQKAHEAFDRIAPELTGQHRRNLRLIDAHQLCRCCLGQPSLLYGPADPDDQSCFNQVFGGIGQAEIREYVSRAGLLFKDSPI